jgi:hypothetical protein
VLKRPEHRLAHGLSLEAIDEFLAELAALIEPVVVHFQWRPQSRDPADEMVLEADQWPGGRAGHVQRRRLRRARGAV